MRCILIKKEYFLKMLFGVLTAFVGAPIFAANHALVMWIGAYPDDAKLPGIHLDAAMAKKLAKAMGVPNQNITEFSNASLTANGFANALNNFQQKVKVGDQVFIYYSGHGAQMNSSSGAKCSEGMVGIDLTPFPDVKIEQYLKLIGNKAKQVVMFNDSCFSGGQVSKSLDDDSSNSDFEIKPKLLKSEWLIEDKANPSSYQCGDSINARVSKALDSASQTYGSNFLYIAASSEKEVSFATSLGSAATLAWSACLNPKSDTDRSGQISGQELQVCAQDFLNGKNPHGKKFNQHINLLGNAQLPLVFTSESVNSTQENNISNNTVASSNRPNINTAPSTANTSSSAQATIANSSNSINQVAIPTTPNVPRNNATLVANNAGNVALQNRISTQTTQTTQSSNQVIRPNNATPLVLSNGTGTNIAANGQTTLAPATFADLHAMSNSKIKVQLAVLKNRLKIGQDYLEMKLQHEREAYLYIFYSSSSNTSIDVLFPNPRSPNNKLKAGSYLFPSPDWALRSVGPAGDGALIAVSSSTPLDFSLSKGSDTFETTAVGVKQFFELISAKPDAVIGASSVVKVTEYE